MTPNATQTQAPVLIVDDHADTAEMLRRLLTRNGFSAEVVLDAGEAMEKLAKQKPSCVILDETMPGMTGIELLRHIQGQPRYKGIPVVFYSAAFDQRKQMEAEKLGAKAWFIKGVSRLPDLMEKVKASSSN